MGYFLLSIASLFPVILAVIIKAFFHESKYTQKQYMPRQIIIGVLFGLLAVVGTEWGIKMNGAVVNARDAAVITAGLMFGAPAGIIAGVIGGVERWFAVYWGAGTFTRVACSVSTIIAGIASGLARKLMFDDRRPTWIMGFAVGFVIETFHLAMVFYTNIDTPIKALAVVEACAIPMIIANSVSVLITGIALDIVKHLRAKDKVKTASISATMQFWLLGSIAVALIFTNFFTYALQNSIAINERNDLLQISIEETEDDIKDASNENMLLVTRATKEDVVDGIYTLSEIAEKHEVAEINIVNAYGIITDSTEPTFIGYDMNSGEQSRAFMCLLDDEEEYVQDYMATSYNPNLFRKYAGIRTSNGFVQVGYDYDQFVHNVSAQLDGMTKNRHVGEEGFVLIVDQGSSIVSMPETLNKGLLGASFASFNNPGKGKVFKIKYNGIDYYAMYKTSEGYNIISFIPVSEIENTKNIALYAGGFNEILVFGLLFTLVYMLLKNRVIAKIDKVNGSLERITSGDLNEVVNVRSNREFVLLSNDINATVDTLKGYIDEANKRIDAELLLAKNIQSSALPKPYPMFSKYKEFRIAAYMGTAKEVGGDFYDFYMTDNTINFLIADVSGKGIPAAMFMMRAKAELKSLSESGVELSEAFKNANNELCTGNDLGMFVTAWQGQVDLNSGLLRFANAGHNHPLLKRKNGKFEYLKSRPNLVLAGMEGIPYKSNEVQLEPGDILFLYTDGVTEATNANNELYSEERLQEKLNSREFGKVDDICEFIKGDIDEFVGEAPQFDDITMVCFEFKGKHASKKLEFTPAEMSDIPAITEFVENELTKINCPMKVIVKINVAIDEIYSNIVRYAYGDDNKGEATIILDVDLDDQVISLTFEDAGVPYNPLAKADPNVELALEDREIGGLGIFMVKKSMDEVIYAYENKHNILTLIKKY